MNLLVDKGIWKERALPYRSLIPCASIHNECSVLSGEAFYSPELAFQLLFIFYLLMLTYCTMTSKVLRF